MIAVTGASGYIGSATVDELARRGHEVAAVSRAAGPRQPAVGVQWRSTGRAFPTASAFAGCQAVIHLAGRAHTNVGVVDGQDMFELENRQLALATAQAAHEAGVRRFVFVSTLGVHGAGSSDLLSADSPVRPDSAYARSKLAAEGDLAAWCARHGMELCIVRPPMVYGPRSPGNFQRLLRLVRGGVPLPFASLHARRSFIFVGNLASFLSDCANKTATGTYLVGDGSDWSVAELVRAMASELGTPQRIFPVPVSVLRLAGTLAGRRREVDSLTLPMRVSSAAARRDFAWQPPIVPEEALKRSVQDTGA